MELKEEGPKEEGGTGRAGTKREGYQDRNIDKIIYEEDHFHRDIHRGIHGYFLLFCSSFFYFFPILLDFILF